MVNRILDCFMKLRLVLVRILMVLGSVRNSTNSTIANAQQNDDFRLLSSGTSILNPFSNPNDRRRLPSAINVHADKKNQNNGDRTRYFETSVEGEHSFHGIAFNVRAKNNVILQTMNILIKTQPKIPNIRIYTKAGSFWNQNDNAIYQPDYWTLISTTESLSYPLLASYSVTIPTTNSTTLSIPLGIFNSVSISAGSMQAFYVSLNTSTLLYSSSNNAESSETNNTPIATASHSYANTIYKENDDLSVYVGAGVGYMDLFHQGLMDKNVTMIADRAFNGMFYYTRPFYSSATIATKETLSTSYEGASNNDTNQFAKQLSTTYEGGNGGFGIMFDVIALQPLTIKTLSINIARSANNRPVEVKVWTLSSGEGSYIGHESTIGTADWKCIMTCTLNGAGVGNPTVIPEELFPDTYTKAGHVRAFYISLNVPNLIYTVTTNETYFSALNDDLQIITGVGFSTPTPIITNTNNNTTAIAEVNGIHSSSSLSTPLYHPNRAFNGAIIYILPGTTESTSKSISTTIGGANAALGNMFDIEALRDITVKRIDIVITTNKQVNVVIYTKIGSYRGFGETVNAWTQILSMSVTGAGSFTPVPLAEHYFTSNVFIKAGSIQGFYISLNEPYLSYTAGVMVGNAFAVNDDLRISEGASLFRHFRGLFEPRRWSGVVYYDTNKNINENTASATNISSSAHSESLPIPLTIGPEDVRRLYSRSLITTLKGSNGAQGCMFDVSTSISVLILGIDVHTVVKGEMIDVELYTKTDTFELNEEKPSVWGQPVLSASVMGKGLRNLTPLPDINPLVEVPGGQVQSFYVRSKTSELRYSNGPVDPTSNPDMTISLGVGIRDNFQNVFKNRTCNVAIRYLLQSDSPATMEKAVLGNPFSIYTSISGQKMSFGIMFTLVANEDVFIHTLSIHSATVPAQTYKNTTTKDLTYVEVFTKSDSYSGFESNPVAWSKVGASKLKISGRGSLSQIPAENFLGVLVKAGSKQSFYVTDTEGPTIISTVGEEGSPIATPSDHGNPIMVLAGCGIDSYPFGTKISGRLFNGRVHFALVTH